MYARCVNARALVFPLCVMASDDPPSVLPTVDDMREAVTERFGLIPCTWQLEAALTQAHSLGKETC